MSQRILIIEDEAQIKKDLVRTLNLCKYETLDASNGLIGLELAKKYKPDLIISDIMMPKMDGYRVLKELQANPATATIPFLFLTAKSDKSDIREGMKMGADDFITKPYDIDELLQAVKIRLKKKETDLNLHSEKYKKLSSSINRSMPHEVRTPLSLILGYTDYMIKKNDSLSRNEIKEMLINIHDAGKRLNRLYENFLFYMNLETIAGDAEELRKIKSKKSYSSELILRDVISYHAEESKRQKDIICDLTDAALKISEEFFQKLVKEILDNCTKFSDSGTQIEISSEVRLGRYILSFTDYGRGMNQDQIDNISPFIQFERKIYEQQGSGLGIAIARRIVELHDGEFSINSRQNEFTTVTIKLPVL